MGDQDIDPDPIWEPAPGAAPESPSTPTTEAGSDEIWMADTDAAAPWPAPAPPDRGHRVRLVLGVACLAVAAIAAFLVLRGDDEPETRAVGKAVTATPKTEVLGAEASAPSNSGSGSSTLVPTTVADGAVVKCGVWDAAANYAPEVQTDGVFIWSDFEGWHVRSAGTEVGTLTGKVTGSVRPNLFDQEEPERVDASGPEDGVDVYFTIRPGAEPVGFDFSAGCTQQLLAFDLKSDGEPIDPALVHLGTNGGVADVPFIISRTPEPG